jgi:hypothetical protein
MVIVINEIGQWLGIPKCENEVNEAVLCPAEVSHSHNVLQTVVCEFFQICCFCEVFAVFVERTEKSFTDVQFLQCQTSLPFAIQLCLNLNQISLVFCLLCFFDFPLMLHLYAFVYVFIANGFPQLLNWNVIIDLLFVGRRRWARFSLFLWRLKVYYYFLHRAAHYTVIIIYVIIASHLMSNQLNNVKYWTKLIRFLYFP